MARAELCLLDEMVHLEIKCKEHADEIKCILTYLLLPNALHR